MLCKLVLVASLAVGVFCPVTSSHNPYDYADDYNPYGETGNPEYYDWLVGDIATQYCEASTAEDKVPEVKASIKRFVTSLVKELDIDAMTRDIGEARYTRVYDGVVKKYCAKSLQYKKFTSFLIKDVAVCLPSGKASILETRIFGLIDFLCHNGGATINSLIEHGPPCLQTVDGQLKDCSEEMVSKVPKLIATSEERHSGVAAGAMKISNKEKCDIADHVSCFTNALKTCSSKTPAELSQKLQDIFRDSLPCSGVSIILQNGVLRLMLAILFLHLLIDKFNNKC